MKPSNENKNRSWTLDETNGFYLVASGSTWHDPSVALENDDINDQGYPVDNWPENQARGCHLTITD